jgi:hypothetical protein
VSHLIAYRDNLSQKTKYIREGDRNIALELVDAVFLEGFELVGIAAHNEDFPLNVADAEARQRAKSSWRELYKTNIYADEEAYALACFRARHPGA